MILYFSSSSDKASSIPLSYCSMKYPCKSSSLSVLCRLRYLSISRHLFVATVMSQAFSCPSFSNVVYFCTKFINVSCTASSASAEFLSITRHILYSISPYFSTASRAQPFVSNIISSFHYKHALKIKMVT